MCLISCMQSHESSPRTRNTSSQRKKITARRSLTMKLLTVWMKALDTMWSLVQNTASRIRSIIFILRHQVDQPVGNQQYSKSVYSWNQAHCLLSREWLVRGSWCSEWHTQEHILFHTKAYFMWYTVMWSPNRYQSGKLENTFVVFV